MAALTASPLYKAQTDSEEEEHYMFNNDKCFKNTCVIICFAVGCDLSLERSINKYKKEIIRAVLSQ